MENKSIPILNWISFTKLDLYSFSGKHFFSPDKFSKKPYQFTIHTFNIHPDSTLEWAQFYQTLLTSTYHEGNCSINIPLNELDGIHSAVTNMWLSFLKMNHSHQSTPKDKNNNYVIQWNFWKFQNPSNELPIPFSHVKFRWCSCTLTFRDKRPLAPNIP